MRNIVWTSDLTKAWDAIESRGGVGVFFVQLSCDDLRDLFELIRIKNGRPLIVLRESIEGDFIDSGVDEFIETGTSVYLTFYRFDNNEVRKLGYTLSKMNVSPSQIRGGAIKFSCTFNKYMASYLDDFVKSGIVLDIDGCARKIMGEFLPKNAAASPLENDTKIEVTLTTKTISYMGNRFQLKKEVTIQYAIFRLLFGSNEESISSEDIEGEYIKRGGAPQ